MREPSLTDASRQTCPLERCFTHPTRQTLSRSCRSFASGSMCSERPMNPSWHGVIYDLSDIAKKVSARVYAPASVGQGLELSVPKQNGGLMGECPAKNPFTHYTSDRSRSRSSTVCVPATTVCITHTWADFPCSISPQFE